MAQPATEHRQRLQYICDMLEQLRAISPPQAGPLLPYLIDVARLEASERLTPPPKAKANLAPQGKIET